MVTLARPDEVIPQRRLYQPHGAALDLLYNKHPEVILSGPAGTGKSRACLEKIHLCAEKYPGMRALFVRKTRASVTESALVTYEDKVLPVGHGAKGNIQRNNRQAYHYPNGSEIVVGGLDNANRIMSTEYDMIYVQEGIELLEDDWEKLTTRLRNGVMPYQQLLADTNPDAPTHWLKQRSNGGPLQMLESRHEDNPTLYDPIKRDYTPHGLVYLSKLDALTGPRKLRLRHGQWVQAEGVVYESFDPAIHVIDRFEIPEAWPRDWVIDFGYTNPFVWQDWTEDPDGRLILVREIYRTKTLVEDHAKAIKTLTEGQKKPRRVICDHDAEDRATLEKHLGVRTVAAHKTVTDGIQAVQVRLKVQPDGKPRIMFMRDAVVKRDPSLVERIKPTCTVEEFPSYVWDLENNRKKGEEPKKLDDHGMDVVRYRVAEADLAKPRSFGMV